ncbi:MAG TPA: 16S rRNA (adenine(1518)-N(6)/adenine(1519)-N(6))-dimethyltransferase RsmA [Solirubrobacteraceae bacterium]|nr:16S rRNA (adenine(1518)-N(6)/adenine(1519)-N(6))-dimethyltransferase RsmA [Solirubrobacteraceae bacterium]
MSARSARQRDLGQNFLVDRNILDVIGRLAELSSADVVLEVGGGPGVLSTYLAPRVAHLHVVEVDERLRERLSGELASFDNVSLHVADALELDLAALSPPPGKMVANLPYGVAATLVLRTIDALPSLTQWVVMVQREVGERFAASPGTSAYGVPSVLAQLACQVRVLRPVSRSVFRPVPNVDSVLLGLRRFAPGAEPPVTALVHAAFAHRRKALARSLALAGGGFPSDVRDRARAGLLELGHPADERAERLTPAEFRELARRIAT